MADDVTMPGPPGDSGGGGKLFGLPLPIVLLGGGALVFLFLARSSGSKDNTNMVPMSTAVQLGDIQERQLEIEQGLSHGFADAQAERANYNQSQLAALSATETHIIDQLNATQQSLEQSMASGDNAVIQQLTDQRNYLKNLLDNIRNNQDAQFTALLGTIGQSDYLQKRWDDYITSIIQGFGNSVSNPGTNDAGFADPNWYSGWRAAFGSTGGKYDVNKDNRVDILDFNLWRQYIERIGGDSPLMGA